MSVLSAVLYSYGYTVRSGGAKGADEDFEAGVLSHPHFRSVSKAVVPPMEIFLPWDNFKPDRASQITKCHDPENGYINAKTLDAYPWAEIEACFIHPAPLKLKANPANLALHTRNIFQIRGPDLTVLSKRLYCWAPPTADGLVEGGTRTAVALAAKCGMPWTNLFEPDALSRVIGFLHARYDDLATSKTFGATADRK